MNLEKTKYAMLYILEMFHHITTYGSDMVGKDCVERPWSRLWLRVLFTKFFFKISERAMSYFIGNPVEIEKYACSAHSPPEVVTQLTPPKADNLCVAAATRRGTEGEERQRAGRE